jgi:mannose-1-phosphate guanylyltransferase
MIVLIIAGGSGTRLWPLSTPNKPKHLLKVNGENSSLLQNTFKRASLISDKIYVVTEKSHDHLVRKQLKKISPQNIIVEPSRRGTANCIVLALSHLEKEGLDLNEPVVILAADHYVDDNNSFKSVFKDASEYSQKNNSIVLVGIQPNYPATGFGYIKLGQKITDQKYLKNDFFKVDCFKEKPNLAVAEEYLKSKKYLWNAGYFIGSIKTFKKEFKDANQKLLDAYNYLLSNNNIDNYYNQLDSISIDYALIEKIKKIFVVAATFSWLDLGSYKDLLVLASNLKDNNYLKGRVVVEEVKDSYICNHQKKPLVVIGLEDVIVINTKHGLLVTKKDFSQKIGDISKTLD